MKNVLVLCTGNSCRSQMAHGYLKLFAGSKAQIYSAGIETHGLNQRAVTVMKEDGVDISSNTSNNVLEYADVNFDFIITVCDHANENCPYFPSRAIRLHHNFVDPAKATGTEEEILNSFRSTQNMVKDYCQKFVAQEL
ncbi:MAG: arsenate reductase ArsC [bacterium]|nr:arsenate reductase ArsC [bacterium]